MASIIIEFKEKCAKNDWKNVPHLDKLNLLIIYVEKRDYYVDLISDISDQFEKSTYFFKLRRDTSSDNESGSSSDK